MRNKTGGELRKTHTELNACAVVLVVGLPVHEEARETQLRRKGEVYVTKLIWKTEDRENVS